MAARKKCPKCGAGNESEAVSCSLCGQALSTRTTMEAFELEPRQWTGSTQRHRGEVRAEENAAARAGSVARPHPTPSSDQVPAETHYLLPPVGPAFKLDPSVSSFVFGRDEGCNVRIASPKVSRRHAELTWRGSPPQLFLRDLNSQNGTYLNDQKLTDETALANGDTLRMGDYVASYRLLEPGDDPAALVQRGNDTAVMETVVVPTESHSDASEAGLTGDAAILPIQEVLRRLLALHAHGMLSVDVAGTHGEMSIVDGRAVEGSYAGLDGAPAIMAMSSLTKGRFRFDATPSPSARSNAPTTRMTPPSNDGTTPLPNAAPARPAARPAPAPTARPTSVQPRQGTPPGAGSGPRPNPPTQSIPRPAPRPQGPPS